MQYADQYDSMSGGDADIMTKKVIALKRKTDKLIALHKDQKCYRRNRCDTILPDRILHSWRNKGKGTLKQYHLWSGTDRLYTEVSPKNKIDKK